MREDIDDNKFINEFLSVVEQNKLTRSVWGDNNLGIEFINQPTHGPIDYEAIKETT